MVKTSPYLRDSLVSERCGLKPSQNKDPIDKIDVFYKVALEQKICKKYAVELR